MNTVESFGNQYGRLGNQLFQLSLLFAVRQRRGHDFYLPRHGEPLWDCFDLDVPVAGPECTNRFEEGDGWCTFDPRVFEQPDGTSYDGYFQSYRYLEDCKASLVQFLRFKFSHRARSEALLLAYRRRYRRPLVSMHVRRADYVNPDAEDVWGNLATDGYYQRVVDAIGDDVAYLVFSDDLEWCRQFFDLECVEFADFDHCTSLCLMTGCDVSVVANSTFGWWGAFLNPVAEVYAPSRWFRGIDPPNKVQFEIVPPEWRTIPTFVGHSGTEPRPPRGAPMDRPVRNAKFEVNQVDDGYVVYDERRDRIHYLNHTGALVLELCTGENTSEDIVVVLQKAYDLPAPPEAETKACLQQLREEGLIR
ncbi:MAG: hypothetical protein JWP02_1585 [Acidimicrobiales bacterium]|nr:hypothetical protein [Acidimicrobiales bacterium]